MQSNEFNQSYPIPLCVLRFVFLITEKSVLANRSETPMKEENDRKTYTERDRLMMMGCSLKEK